MEATLVLVRSAILLGIVVTAALFLTNKEERKSPYAWFFGFMAFVVWMTFAASLYDHKMPQDEVSAVAVVRWRAIEACQSSGGFAQIGLRKVGRSDNQKVATLTECIKVTQ